MPAFFAPASIGIAGFLFSAFYFVFLFFFFLLRGRRRRECEVEPVEPSRTPPLLLLPEPLLLLLKQLAACALGIGQRAPEEERALKKKCEERERDREVYLLGERDW